MGTATKTCPQCKAAAMLYADACASCGARFPAQAFPEEDVLGDTSAEEPPQDLTMTGSLMETLRPHMQLLLCLLGACLFIAGVFMPILGIDSMFGPLTLMKMHTGPVLILACMIACVFALLRKFPGVAFFGSSLLTFLSARLIPLWKFTRAQDSVGAGMTLLELRYGWIVLLLAAVLMVLGGAYDVLLLPSDPTERSITERKRAYFLLSCVAGIGLTVMLLMFSQPRRRLLTTLPSPNASTHIPY